MGAVRDHGKLLDIVEGRSGAVVADWLAGRDQRGSTG